MRWLLGLNIIFVVGVGEWRGGGYAGWNQYCSQLGADEH
jgi:hypothetical protein